MKIVDLTEEHLPLFLVCLEDWSDEIKGAGDHKRLWYERMKDKGLRVKLALDDNGTVGGMIQYVPVEHSPVDGEGLYFINCIWVHGHKQGRGDFRGRGMGRALLQAAEDDARSIGARGIVAWGLMIPVFMRASWFRRHGYHVVDRSGIQGLLLKPFVDEVAPPRWIRTKRNPELGPGKVTVTAFCNGWCPAQNLALERARKASADPAFAGKVVFREVDTFERDEVRRWGQSDALFIDHKLVRTGPPPSYEKIHRLIERRVRKLR